MRVLDGFWQFARGAGGVLINRQVGSARVGLERGAFRFEFAPERLIDLHHLRAGKLRRQRAAVTLCQHQFRGAVVDPQRQAFGAEQGEQRHADRAALDRAKQADVKPERGFEDHRDAVALGDTAFDQPVGETPGQVGQTGKVVVFRMAVGKLDAYGGAASTMPIQAFVGQIHSLGVAVEQRPQLVPGKAGDRFSVGGEFRDVAHVACRCLSGGSGS